MYIHGSAAISDLLDDFVAYRSLRPADPRLPGLAEIRPGSVPRKGDMAYAEIVAEILRAARRLTQPLAELRRVLVIGDTQRSDGGAFETICAATGWRGRCFICDEQPGKAPITRQQSNITYANAWQALYAFHATLEAEEFPLDAGTVVVLDIDKTLIGAKGRNHRLIDQARLAALRAAVAETLGSAFDQQRFEQTYRELDQARYHPLTEDNQDNVAYLCVVIGGGVLDSGEPAGFLGAGYSFRDVLDAVGARLAGTNPALARFHSEIAQLVQAGDPTPFKAFRQREYVETSALLGYREGATVEQLLTQELVITAEVWQVAQEWARRGALLFGLSDKPDEAAIPSAAAALLGALPLHRMRTHIVGIYSGGQNG